MTARLLGSGGEGTVLGLMASVLIIGVLNNGMQLASLQDFLSELGQGRCAADCGGF